MRAPNPIRFLRLIEILYLSLIVLSFYLLFLSRTGEAHTVWEVLHPVFIPVLFIVSSLLVAILTTSEKLPYKLLFVIVHSVLVHSLFSMIFPVGDLSGQQMVLGRTRLVYENAILHGWPPWQVETVQSQIYQFFRGENFQAALSVVFSRMCGVDILNIHLFLVPVLWGTFTPIAAYLTAHTLTKNEKLAVISSLIISAFPYTIYFGAISVPNSLGFIFFFYALYFMLKNLESNDSKSRFLMLAFSFISLLSHYLTGVMSLSLLILFLAFKSYRSEKSPSSTAKAFLLISFAFCSSLLPLSLIYLRFFRSGTFTAFTLDKLYQLPLEESVGLFFLGQLIYGFDLKTVFLVVVGPTVALIYFAYVLYRSRSRKIPSKAPILFLFAAFLLMLVDYRILKLLMEGLPLNEERLWVLRDFIAAPFVASAIFGIYSSLSSILKARSRPTVSFNRFKPLSKSNAIRVSTLLLALNIVISMVLGGWITFSLTAAYPQVGPLQTTWYELEAVKYIEETTDEKYVVIGDIWTIFAGEVIVGIYNPRAFYFLEYDMRGITLFNKMREEPSPEVMIEAMNQTGTETTVAYFIVTEPRLGTDEFNKVVSLTLENEQLRSEAVFIFGDGKLYVFSYRKQQGV